MIEVAEGVGVRVIEVFFPATESSVRVFFFVSLIFIDYVPKQTK